MTLSALSPDDLLCALQAEFDRLNTAHFTGCLTRPEIVLSRRKTYGGYYQPRRHRIVLSLQAYREYGWEEVLNTFRHEVAHIAHPNHSRAFWDLAHALGATQRYARPPLHASRSHVKLHVYECPACKRLIKRVRRLRNSSCGACDTHYNPAFRLRLLPAE